MSNDYNTPFYEIGKHYRRQFMNGNWMVFKIIQVVTDYSSNVVSQLEVKIINEYPEQEDNWYGNAWSSSTMSAISVVSNALHTVLGKKPPRFIFPRTDIDVELSDDEVVLETI